MNIMLLKEKRKEDNKELKLGLSNFYKSSNKKENNNYLLENLLKKINSNNK